MSKSIAKHRGRVPPTVLAVAQPITKRLSRIEALLLEMRHEQDVQLKRISALHVQLDALTADRQDQERE